MIIEVVGISPRNKGALLMLDAVCEVLRERYSDVLIAIPGPWPAKLRLQRGLWLSSPTSGRSILRLIPLVPKKLRYVLGVVASHEVDVVIDASGFGYGDYWGVRAFHRRIFSRAKGRRVVLLPQAVGPFNDTGMAAAWRRVVDLSEIVFVRDSVSLQYSEDAIGVQEKIMQAPDFTNLLKVELPVELEPWSGRAFLIPNRKMISESVSLESYLDFLELALKALRERGTEPVALIHEGADDRALIEQLNRRVSPQVEILEVESAIHTKAVISRAQLIIASRFHGIVSALSSGVPALSAGWSHKYAELTRDYDCESHLVDMSKPDTWGGKISAFLADAVSPSFRSKLQKNAEAQKKLSADMWSKVLNILSK